MKWKWRNDRRSERNLCNCVKNPEKKNQDFNGVWTRDLAITGAMLYQLSYEATDVGSRSIVGSYVPVKEMSVNHIWNKSYMNYGNEMKMKKWSSQWTQFMQLRKEAWKKIQDFNGVWTRDLAITGAMLYQLSYELLTGFFTQLHKLRSLRRSFLHFHFISAVHTWFIS